MQRLNYYFLLSFAFASMASAQTDPIVMDETQAEFTGRWQTLTEAAGYGHGSTFRYAMNTDEKEATGVAIFRPTIPVSGKYHVEVASSPGRNRSPKVPCLIKCADGEIRVLMDQTLKPGGWHRIAENLQFEQGTNGSVQIANNGGVLAANDKIVIADGVRFVPSDDSIKGFQLLTTVGTGGHILLDPKKKTFEPNSIVKLTAEPDDGFVFESWSGDATGSANPLALTMDKMKRITANFSEGNAGAILDASNAKFEGSWLTNAAKWGARTNYLFASTCIRGGGATPIATAIYQPKLSKAGLYDIYIWYSKGPNRADTAPWEIVGKDKTFTVKVNQQVNGGDWFPIASGVEFEAGTNGYVKLSNQTGFINSVVVADSVAFVYVGN
jgi:hypothetical protein